MDNKVKKKMGKRVRETYIAVLEALKAHHCISGYSITENNVEPKWEDGGIERVVQEVTTNSKPFGLNRNHRGGLLMVLPQNAREKADAFFLDDFKKKYGLGLVLWFLMLGVVAAQQPVSTNAPKTGLFDDLIPKQATPQSPRQIAQSTFPSVVLLVMEDANGQPISLGSGFFVQTNIIASNFHVIEGASQGYAKLIGTKTKYDITGLVGLDFTNDLVLLTVKDAMSPALSLADSHKAVVGDEVFVAGNPQGLEGTFSQGIVSGIRDVESGTLLQITAPISPGSSGGPVLNSEGKVIGISVATFTSGQNLNFAIPANYLAPLLIASNTNGVIPFGHSVTTRQGKSNLDNLGGRSTDGVTGGQLTWENQLFDFDGNFSFTIQNKLHDSVKNVYCLVIFYDRNDSPIDIAVTRYEGTIPGGLGKRIIGSVDRSVKRLTTNSKSDNPGLSSLTPATKTEFRVLDFKIDE